MGSVARRRNQRVQNGEGLDAREQPRRQRPVTMQALAYVYTPPTTECLPAADWASGLDIDMHSRRQSSEPDCIGDDSKERA